jgi:hypothetical protein
VKIMVEETPAGLDPSPAELARRIRAPRRAGAGGRALRRRGHARRRARRVRGAAARATGAAGATVWSIWPSARRRSSPASRRSGSRW